MPLYEYCCKECSHQFELMKRISEADDTTLCPACNSEHTVRMISLVNARISAGGTTKAISGGCGSCSSSGAGCSSCHH